MSGRSTLPDTLVTSTLTPSAEGLTIKQPIPAVTFSQPSQPIIEAKILSPPPSVVPPQNQPASQPIAQAILQPSIPAVLSQPAVEIAAPAPVVMSQNQVGGKSAEIKDDGWGITINPLMVIFLILVFVVVFIILYVTKTNMVTDLVNGERVLNNSKLVFWTVLISITLSVVAFIVSAVFKRKSSPVI